MVDLQNTLWKNIASRKWTNWDFIHPPELCYRANQENKISLSCYFLYIFKFFNQSIVDIFTSDILKEITAH